MRLLATALLATAIIAGPALAEDGGSDGGASPPAMDRDPNITNPGWDIPVYGYPNADMLAPYAIQRPYVVQQSQVTSPVPAAPRILDRQDEIFLHEMAAAGMTEVEFARLAQKNAGSAAVKDFAKQLVDDHTRANDRLEALVRTSEIKLPTTMNEAYKKTYADLQKLKGASFDRAYVKVQVDDHKKVVQMLEHEASAGKDPQLKTFAAETLPVVKHHLETAQSLQTRVQMSKR